MKSLISPIDYPHTVEVDGRDLRSVRNRLTEAEERLAKVEMDNRRLHAEMAKLLIAVQEKLRERDLLLSRLEDTLARKVVG